MSIVEISTVAVSILLGASRLLKAAQPLWNKLPRVVAVALPVVVLSVPKLVELFGGVHTTLDLTETLVLAAALLVPGIAEAEKPAPEPVTPPVA